MSKGHKVVLHYFREEERFVRPEFDYIQSLQGRKQEAQISALLLSSCENIAISPHMWEQIGERRQQAILKNVPGRKERCRFRDGRDASEMGKG